MPRTKTALLSLPKTLPEHNPVQYPSLPIALQIGSRPLFPTTLKSPTWSPQVLQSGSSTVAPVIRLLRGRAPRRIPGRAVPVVTRARWTARGIPRRSARSGSGGSSENIPPTKIAQDALVRTFTRCRFQQSPQISLIGVLNSI